MLPAVTIGCLLAVGLFFNATTVCADYTIVLKNGRRLTVQSYREEEGMVKFQGLGGEIGIARDQVQSILQAEDKERRGMVVPGSERSPESAEGVVPPEAKETAEGKAQEKVFPKGDTTPGSAEEVVDQRAKEEKEYLKRVEEVTEQIKIARERYFRASGGSGSSNPTLLNTEGQIKGRTDDLVSRLRDAQHNPRGSTATQGGSVNLATPSPFVGLPPTDTQLRPVEPAPAVDTPLPGYTPPQKELSDLRNRIYELEAARERLIQEMKQKNLDTGSVFLE